MARTEIDNAGQLSRGSLMIAHQRQTDILRLLAQKRRLRLADLAGPTGASPATLRRDVDFLASQNLLVRLHGIILHPSVAAKEPSLLKKQNLAVRAKQRIGTAAAALAAGAKTVFIDSGTTCLEVARHLRRNPDLTTVTNSLPVIAGYAQCQARLVVIGGEHRCISGALVGDSALEALTHWRADLAFVGASGLDPAADPGTTELLEKSIKTAWLQRSRRRVLLCDATKWTSASSIIFSKWEKFTDFVTDQPAPANFRPKKLSLHFA
jgi:DeoR/GlpR family transcriptional regulator of sugar metabolism